MNRVNMLACITACCEKLQDPFGEHQTRSDIIAYYCINAFKICNASNEKERMFCIQTSYTKMQCLVSLCKLLLTLQTGKSSALWNLHSYYLILLGRPSEVTRYVPRRPLPLPETANFDNIQLLQTYLSTAAKTQRRMYLHTYYHSAGLSKLLRGRPEKHSNVLDYITDTHIMESNLDDTLQWTMTSSIENHDRRQLFKSTTLFHTDTTVCGNTFRCMSTDGNDEIRQLYLHVVRVKNTRFRYCAARTVF